MREKDEITGLFRSRLAGAEMTVREDFWEELQRDLPSPASAKGRKQLLLSPRFHRVAAAASVVFVLGAASAAFWYFSPKEEIKEAFTQVAAMTPEGKLNGDIVQESFPSIHQTNPVAQKPGAKQPANGIPAGLTAQVDEDESLSVHVSIRITQRVYGNLQQPGNGYYANGTPASNGNYHSNPDRAKSDINQAVSSSEGEQEKAMSASLPESRNWALKAGVGTSLPKGDCNVPFTAGISVERRLNKLFSLEAGLQYNRLDGDHTLHTLGIPVRLNMMLASTPKVDFYAMAGGTAEKCIAGAPDNGFGAEPVQLSVAAGIGVRYKMNDRFALFAEPSVSHHFDTDSQTRTLRTERPTNLNMLCGVRMTY